MDPPGSPIVAGFFWFLFLIGDEKKRPPGGGGYGSQRPGLESRKCRNAERIIFYYHFIHVTSPPKKPNSCAERGGDGVLRKCPGLRG